MVARGIPAERILEEHRSTTPAKTSCSRCPLSKPRWASRISAA
jgi:hypothetical protein